MKYLIESLVRDALAALPADLRGADASALAPTIERTRDPSHGDFATNAAMQLARVAKRKPRELAEALVAALPANELVARVEIAGPGFINFHLSPAAYTRELERVLEQGDAYGRSRIVACQRVMV